MKSEVVLLNRWGVEGERVVGRGGAKKRGAMVRMMSVMKGEPCIGGLGNTDGESGQGQKTQGGSRGKGQVTMQGGRGPAL